MIENGAEYDKHTAVVLCPAGYYVAPNANAK